MQLHDIEQKIAAGKMDFTAARALLLNNPLSKREVNLLATEVRKGLARCGIEIDRTKVYHRNIPIRESYSEGDVWDIDGPYIDIPAYGFIHTPLVIAYCYAQRKQLEGVLWNDGASQGDAWKKFYADTKMLRIGWHLFVAERYAEFRDNEKGISLYAPMHQRMAEEKYSLYGFGAKVYQDICAVAGMAEAVKAAMESKNDEELFAFAEKRRPIASIPVRE